jgi:hypothetical protein
MFLTLAAMACFAALPAFAQHGGGHGGGSGSGHGGDSHSADSGHGDSHSDSSHGGSASADDHGHGHHGGHGSISAKLARDPALAAKLQAMLPPGTDLNAAAQGFKNLGQFVAALHVSQNLGIPFDQLKAKLTGPGAENLGKAIQDLKPGVDAKAAAKLAEKEAKADIHSANETREANDNDHDANDDHGVDSRKTP